MLLVYQLQLSALTIVMFMWYFTLLSVPDFVISLLLSQFLVTDNGISDFSLLCIIGVLNVLYIFAKQCWCHLYYKPGQRKLLSLLVKLILFFSFFFFFFFFFLYPQIFQSVNLCVCNFFFLSSNTGYIKKIAVKCTVKKCNNCYKLFFFSFKNALCCRIF